MTVAEMRNAAEQAIAAVPYEPPVSVAFATAVRDVLRELVPAGTSIEVYHDGVSIRVGIERRRFDYPLA